MTDLGTTSIDEFSYFKVLTSLPSFNSCPNSNRKAEGALGQGKSMS